MMATIQVRPAQVSDGDAIAALTTQLGYDVDTGLAARLSRILASPDDRLFVAESQEQVVGWLHAVVWEYIETDAFVVIAGLVVDAAHRRQGIGRILMEHAEAWAKEQGHRIVRLWSSAARTDAHRFYERLGYTNLKTQYSFGKALDPAASEKLKHFVPRVPSPSG